MVPYWRANAQLNDEFTVQQQHCYIQATHYCLLLLLLVCIDRSICCLPCSISLRVKSMNVKHTVVRYIRIKFINTSLIILDFALSLHEYHSSNDK
jgi:hypothetical protein